MKLHAQMCIWPSPRVITKCFEVDEPASIFRWVAAEFQSVAELMARVEPSLPLQRRVRIELTIEGPED